MSEQQYINLITDLTQVFDATATGDRKIELYARSLSDIPVEHLAVVVERIINTWTVPFMPTPGEIKDAYVDLVAGPPMPDERLQWCLDTETEQYRQSKSTYYGRDIMTRGAFEYRTQAPVEFPDAVTAETVRLIGWRDLIEMDPDMRKGLWAKRYAEARGLVAKRIQAGEIRLSLPVPGNVRPIKAVS